jgi:methionyl-tRNA formyltransferase
MNWVLINDEKEFGITVHYVDEGIDTGDIILQRTYPITDSIDYSQIINTTYTECGALTREAVKQLQNNQAKLTRQLDIHPVGFYCGKIEVADVVLDWNQPSRDVFNFVRALCKPFHVARSFLNGREMKINKVEMIGNAPAYNCLPGLVVGKEGNTFNVKTRDTFVKVVDYEYDGRVRIGHRLGKIPSLAEQV